MELLVAKVVVFDEEQALEYDFTTDEQETNMIGEDEQCN